MKKFTAEQEEYLRKLELSGRFDKYQMREISDGFLHNLSMEQVKLYAKPEFNAMQMWHIREGFIEGLSPEEIKNYTNPTIKWLSLANS